MPAIKRFAGMARSYSLQLVFQVCGVHRCQSGELGILLPVYFKLKHYRGMVILLTRSGM